MAEKKKNTPKKSNAKKDTTKKKSTPKHTASNVKKNNQKKKTNNNQKKTNTKKQSASNKKKNAKKINPVEFVKSKIIKKKPEPKNAKEKRLQKLEKLRRAKKRNKILKIAGITAGSIYVAGCILFTLVCFPRTVVADTDLSFHTPDFMRSALIPNSGEYVFKADGLDFDLEIDGKIIDYNFDVDKVVERVLELKNPFLWPYEVFVVHDFMTESVVSFNREVAESIAAPAIEAHNETSIKPVNANLVCDPNTREISVKEETVGNTLNSEKTLAEILGYIGSGRRHLECGENEQDLPSLYADDERVDDAIEQGYTLIESVISLTMGQAKVATLNFPNWADWLALKEGYVAGLDDEKLAKWASALAAECDTLGTTRTYTTPYGKVASFKGGENIGWRIDQEALCAMISVQAPTGQIKACDVPCSSKTGIYLGAHQRDWSARYVDVDLGQQHARFYNDEGVLVWQSAIVSGKPGHNTPTGIYTIKQVGGPTTLRGPIDPATGKPEWESTVQY